MHFITQDSDLFDDQVEPDNYGGGHSALKVVLAIFAIGVLLVAILLGVAFYEYSHGISGSPKGAPVTFSVKAGDGFSSVGKRLAAEKVLRSAIFYDVYVKLHPSFTLLPGFYTLHKDESVKAVLGAFKAGPNEFKVTVVPGMTLAEIAARVGSLPGNSVAKFDAALAQKGYSSPFLAGRSSNLEGLLSPDTYFVLPGEKDHQVIQEMLTQTTKVARTAGLIAGSNNFGLSGYQTLVVASLIQREALLAADYPKVARVIYNRLGAGMNLQFDSTVLYGLHLTGGSPTYAQLASPSPYNTYLNPGLPPTPISAPSAAAISAALNPAVGPWLYFVTVSSNGAEAFSVTYAQQLANEALAAARGLG